MTSRGEWWKYAANGANPTAIAQNEAVAADVDEVDGDARMAAARQAAAVVAGAGGVAVAGASAAGTGDAVVWWAALGLIALATGTVAWRLPWHRWPRRALLVLPGIALLLAAAASASATARPAAFAVAAAALAWVGLTQPPGSALVVAPAVAAGVAVAIAISGDGGWTWAALALTCAIGAGVGEAVARTRAVDARRVGDLEAILGASGLLQGDDVDEVNDLLARVATSVLHGKRATVLLEDTVRRDDDDDDAHADVIPEAPAALIEQALTTAHPATAAGLLVVPLRGTGSVFGVVVVHYDEGGETDPLTVRAAQLFGAHAGLALEQLRVREELTTAAMEDALTGVGNRRRAAALLEGLRPGDAVVLIDLDQFKLVNDTAGHATGDRVLVLLGRYLREAARGADTVARYGGDEFLVVLRQAEDGALAATERLVAGWRDLRPITTFSAGVAVHVAGRSPAATLGRADAALYGAKRAGRDQVFADSPTAEAT